jgi:uncharacterized protein YecE (DUF72 family)
MAGHTEFHVGTSGWDYDHWEGVLYPPGLARRQRLRFYQSVFDTVELNASFYHLPPARTFVRWRELSPAGFLWSVKAPRSITHWSRLQRREVLMQFLERAAELDDRLGVILFQLPPTLRFEPSVAERFLDWLPAGRYAIEPREPSWLRRPALALLARHGVALAISDSGGRWPSRAVVTAPFVYVRFHGGPRLYATRYPVPELRRWARRLRRWARPAFVYFNNDYAGYAVENARQLCGLLHLGSSPRNCPVREAEQEPPKHRPKP